jgi:hypothetical protein
MRNSKLLLRIGAALLFITCAGHTVGTFMEIPAEQTEVARAAQVMEQTLVPMPIGRAQSYADIFFGNNVTVSVYLLITAVSFVLFSLPGGLDGAGRRLLATASAGVAALSVISLLYFFPVPAVCTGLAALAGFIVARTG